MFCKSFHFTWCWHAFAWSFRPIYFKNNDVMRENVILYQRIVLGWPKSPCGCATRSPQTLGVTLGCMPQGSRYRQGLRVYRGRLDGWFEHVNGIGLSAAGLRYGTLKQLQDFPQGDPGLSSGIQEFPRVYSVRGLPLRSWKSTEIQDLSREPKEIHETHYAFADNRRASQGQNKHKKSQISQNVCVCFTKWHTI